MSGKYTGKRDNEVFVGNTQHTGRISAVLSNTTPGRSGALDIDGKRLPPQFRAILIGQSEADTDD